MKNVKLNVAKSLLVIALFCPVAFADGDQGSGGFADTDAPVVKTTGPSVEDGDQGSGGRSASTTSYIDTVLTYLDWLI